MSTNHLWGGSLFNSVAQWRPFFLFFGKGVPLQSNNQKRMCFFVFPMATGHLSQIYGQRGKLSRRVRNPAELEVNSPLIFQAGYVSN